VSRVSESSGGVSMTTHTGVRSGALAASAAGVVGYTLFVEPHWIDVVERPLPVRFLPPALIGRRLVHLSDLHVGPRVDSGYLVRALGSVEALEPDLIAITGDLISYEPPGPFAELRRVLAALPRPALGSVAILGNHDYGVNWAQPEVAERVAGELERAGVRVLRNQVAEVAGLRIVGVDDLWAFRFAPRVALLGFPRDVPAIALCHNPDGVDDREGWKGFEGWVLAGHTHGGQCKPPFLPPPMLPVKNRRYTAGEIDAGGGRTLYISRGLGHLIQARFNVRPEITVFTLTAAEQGAPAGG
jgi:uncharacterized protein